ncbi:siderophore-interacting protein [Pseudoruegeria sp. HB172150]|uniref:siderophore-interacting protein n=1 Tax=Pseudoruegeria sp. HB172150 TaxID=2721164 RepID=UPI001557B9A2|nr:siderophore-interacting protein [Pseudoruegeria sp. HB172150]
MPITTRRIRHDLKFRRTTVVSNTRITPQMARIVVKSPELEGFQCPGFDDHIRLAFPEPGQALDKPTPGERGLEWPNGRPETRQFTPRFFDPEAQELTLDFVLHEVGVAGPWAMDARPGDELGVGGPRGSFLVEGQADWELLMGDGTALPAIARRLEALPAGAKARAVIEVADAAEEQQIESAADVEMVWLHADKGETLQGYLDTLSLPEGEGFVFFAAEADAVSKAREKLDALGHPGSHLKASNYWRKGEADAHDH